MVMVMKGACPSTMNMMMGYEAAEVDEVPMDKAVGDPNKGVAAAADTAVVVDKLDKEDSPVDRATASTRSVRVRMRHSFF